MFETSYLGNVKAVTSKINKASYRAQRLKTREAQIRYMKLTLNWLHNVHSEILPSATPEQIMVLAAYYRTSIAIYNMFKTQ